MPPVTRTRRNNPNYRIDNRQNRYRRPELGPERRGPIPNPGNRQNNAMERQNLQIELEEREIFGVNLEIWSKCGTWSNTKFDIWTKFGPIG